MATLTKTPGVTQRARLAWNVFRHGMPWGRKQAGRRTAPLIWPMWRTGRPEWHTIDFGSYVNEGFNLNALIYDAIMYKVRAKISAPLRAYTGDRDKPEPLDPSHPLAQLVDRPNPYQSTAQFESLGTTYLNIAGDCYVMLDRMRGGELPVGMYLVRPDRVYIIPKPGKKRELLGYLYVPEGATHRSGVPVLPQDMMHVKLPNPGDPLDGMGYGLSPLSSLARSADVDNAVTHFLKLFFDRGAMMNGLLKFDVPMDDETVARAKERWQEIYGGYENWTDIGVMDQGGEYQRIGMTFDEMGFSEIDERNESRILGPFGVPAVLVGARVGLERATFSNVHGLRRVFWEDTFIPELQLFLSEYRYYLKTDDGAFVGYDYSEVPALQQDIPTLATAAHQMWQMGMPANQALDTVGLPSAAFEGGDQGYLPAALLPTVDGLDDDVGAPPPAPAPATTQDEGGAIEAEEDERKLWELRAASDAERKKKAAGVGLLPKSNGSGGKLTS